MEALPVAGGRARRRLPRPHRPPPRRGRLPCRRPGDALLPLGAAAAGRGAPARPRRARGRHGGHLRRHHGGRGRRGAGLGEGRARPEPRGHRALLRQCHGGGDRGPARERGLGLRARDARRVEAAQPHLREGHLGGDLEAQGRHLGGGLRGRVPDVAVVLPAAAHGRPLRRHQGRSCRQGQRAQVGPGEARGCVAGAGGGLLRAIGAGPRARGVEVVMCFGTHATAACPPTRPL
mmetsp:Transcript_118137/g.330806  ORF Transcript_118137/g.330806 Transcript_118137/m.330806 type:complete len:234 (+) Transcript_118137:294-995(+)